MNYRFTFAVLLTLFCPAVLAADYPGEIKVTFLTTDCNGATGLASVNVDHITRTQSVDCSNGRKLKQVLTRTPSGANEVYTMTKDEAPKLEAQIQRIMDARQKALQSDKKVIIQH